MVRADLPTLSDFPSDCLDIPFSLCLGGYRSATGDKAHTGVSQSIGQNNLPKDLVGLWTFDDMFAQDQSPNQNPIRPLPSFGPGFDGRGASAAFNFSSDSDASSSSSSSDASPTAYSINHINAYQSSSWTISMWLFVGEPVVGDFRTILYKGSESNPGPHVSLWPESRRIHIRLTTGNDASTSIETLDSNSNIMIGRWSHIGVVVDGKLLSLFVNGILDTVKLLNRPPQFNTDPFYIASDPWHDSLNCFIDQLAIFQRALLPTELAAMGSAAFPGLDPSFYSLACMSCPVSTALEACSSEDETPTHLCTMAELNGGGLIIARVMGWINSIHANRIFALDDKAGLMYDAATSNMTAAEQQRTLGVGLCCKNI